MDNATGEQRLVFQKQNRASGGIEYRINFGRQKVAVLQQSGVGHFYINLYDNRPRFKGRLLFGFDEAEELVRIVMEMGTLKPTFANALEPENLTEVVEHAERLPPPYTAPYTAQHCTSTGALGDSNRNEVGNVPIKKRKVCISQESENQVPLNFIDFFSQPL